MAELTLDSITKVFTEDDGNEIVAVDDVDFEIADGEFLVLVGPSGCGKSTTLRMVAGLETITEGEIRLGGRRINDKPPAERNIAMVFQSYALYPHMTVKQNMSFGLEESTDMSDDEIDEIVTDTAEMMGIANLLDRKPDDLSGGQQQRVALGRAIVRDPEAFLMDEPLSNLDAKLRATMRTELQRLQEDLGVTTVYVTHDQTEAMTMGDRIAVLDDGILQQVGTPLECYHTPNNYFVAGFIGEPSMNFFELDVEGDALVGEHFEYPISDQLRGAVSGSDSVTLGIRPEDVEFRADAMPTEPTDFACTVDVVEPTGDANNVYLTFDDDNSDEPRTFIVTVSGMDRVESGDKVVARFPESAIHLFDEFSGEALKNRSLEDVESVDISI
ncbi:sn-glycerol-3-phosphate ABC transporter ATP-binding protein UgpC [Halapricum sp. CBA1109]|uniref:ABC transporter ATP-binding protein n=1 Tax=Halapricum sp. CBA1109 TaxID=2668068 RepID=UPI0012F95D5F|nr:ABC transporter ATP-binding protein [Halapricum sp. CBA1109]MUV89184.1 sn-glycerol-3-phosphate ABC transporter ATP-binding protein UgpC [Halapricum sp. CBA1109]